MKNIMLLECSAPFWVDIVKKLQEDLKVKPVYWVAWKHIKSSIETNFPDTIFHDTADAKRNISPASTLGYYNSPFTSDAQKVWKEEAQIIYDMLNRFDHSRDLSFLQRQQYFYETLVYWDAILTNSQPELVIFPCPPHVVYDYIAFALCKVKQIKTIMFDEASSLPPYCFSMSDYGKGDEYFTENHLASSDAQEEFELENSLLEFIAKVQSDYHTAKPTREVLAHKNLRKRTFREKSSELIEVLSIFGLEMFNAFFKKSISNHINNAAIIKQARKNLKKSFTSPFQISSYKLQLFTERNLSEKRHDFYHKLCVEPDLSKKYIYLTLAGQPERTSNPQGGIFTFQILIANLLANSVPSDWVIYIKEHPNQFHPYMYVNMYRDEDFYCTLNSMQKVRLIKTNSDPFTLIDNAQAVATIAGTTAIEALLRGKPALVFGEAWYKNCHGIFNVRTLEETRSAISQITSGFKVSENKIRRFLKSIEKFAFKGLGDPLPDGYGISTEENVEALLSKIKKELD